MLLDMLDGRDNDCAGVRTALALHGTSPGVVDEIKRNGVGRIYSPKFAKHFYGQGVYLTQSARYAMWWADKAAKSSGASTASNDAHFVFLCVVQWTNAFAVVEHPSEPSDVVNMPLKDGFDMHYVSVHLGDDGKWKPRRSTQNRALPSAVELVFDHRQDDALANHVVPIALLEFDVET